MNNNCPVCSEGTPIPYSEQKWEFWGNSYRLDSCPSCGCVFTSPLPDDETLKKVYETGFDYRWYQDHYNAKLRDARARVQEYRDIMGKRILDFGGGMGYFSSAAREHGCHSITYDPFVNPGTLTEDKWDTVVSMHALEHSNDLSRTIEQIKDLLVPGGKLILAVPNFLSLGYRKLGMDWVWAQPPLIHTFHLTADGIKKLLARHGFTDFCVSYHERWDANLYTDYKMRDIFRKIDALWGYKYLNSLMVYRRLAALTNSFLRFRGLKRALENYHPDNDIYAELQVVSSLP